MKIEEINYKDMISNVKVYDINESIAASKYPYAVDISEINSDITERTMSLAMCGKGTGHDQFLTGIRVNFDLTFTIKAWTEAERYHFFDFVSSQSTMHRISKFEFDKQYIEYVDKRIIAIMEELRDEYNRTGSEEAFLRLIYNNPVGFKLTARMTTNYRQLKTMYSQRYPHRLPEWKAFCRWIETLPHSEFITGEKNGI